MATAVSNLSQIRRNLGTQKLKTVINLSNFNTVYILEFSTRAPQKKKKQPYTLLNF